MSPMGRLRGDPVSFQLAGGTSPPLVPHEAVSTLRSATPDFKLAPGDRLGLIGDPVHVEAAETLVASFADGVRMDRGVRD